MFNLNAYIVMYKYPRLDQHVNASIQANEYRRLVELNNSEKLWKNKLVIETKVVAVAYKSFSSQIITYRP